MDWSEYTLQASSCTWLPNYKSAVSAQSASCFCEKQYYDKSDGYDWIDFVRTKIVFVWVHKKLNIAKTVTIRFKIFGSEETFGFFRIMIGRNIAEWNHVDTKISNDEAHTCVAIHIEHSRSSSDPTRQFLHKGYTATAYLDPCDKIYKIVKCKPICQKIKTQKVLGMTEL